MAHPPIANLICHWKMNDDAASTVVVDNRGAHNATWTRNTSLDSVTGKINEALSPNALNKAYVADNNDFSFTDGSSDKPFSFAKWVYFDTWRIGDRLINKAAEYEIAVDNNYLFFITRDATGGGGFSRRAPVAYFPTGEWLHIVCTYDGGGIASGRKIYVNSVQRDNDIW